LCRRELERPDRAGRLQVRWNTDIFAAADGESPGMMRRSRDADPFVGDNVDIFVGGAGKTMARINTQIHFMMSIGNVERLRQFPRAGTKSAFIINGSPF